MKIIKGFYTIELKMAKKTLKLRKMHINNVIPRLENINPDN